MISDKNLIIVLYCMLHHRKYRSIYTQWDHYVDKGTLHGLIFAWINFRECRP